MKKKVLVQPSTLKGIEPAELRALYASEPWWPERSETDIAYILDNHISVGAWDGDQLIGFARVVTDGRFRAYIEDVLVLEKYRGAGSGRAIMQKLLSLVEDIHVVTLFCQSRLVPYYTELGFKEFDRQVVMHLRNVR